MRKNEREHAMQIVDAQIHLWGTGLPSNLSHRQVTAFTQPAHSVWLLTIPGKPQQYV